MTRRPSLPGIVALALCAIAGAQSVADPFVTDRDGDGLSDFAEANKYRTDPDRADSDGDGVPDGDWLERREYQYTVRAVVQVMRPVTPEYLNDDYQDVRVLDETAEHVELEVILYPFNSVAATIVGDAGWRRPPPRMRRWLEPGPTADWTPVLRQELVAGLLADGIDVERLDDKALVERASRWLCRRAEPQDGFTTFVTAFDERGAPFVPADLRPDGSAEADLARQWAREISAAGMFRNKVRGSCSSSSIYLNGCLRALGIPTRTVLCIPLVDANDDRELQLLERGMTHLALRRQVRAAIGRLRGSWSSHTFNEVFVGGRWRRLNYDRLGQDIRDRQMFGLMIHVATFSDWADARMPETIGRRQQSTGHGDLFGGANPYSTIALRDEFGAHCALDGSAAELPDPEITQVWWHDDPAVRADVRDWCRRRELFGLIARVDLPADGGDILDYLESANLRVHLRAAGHPTLGMGIRPGTAWRSEDGAHALVVIPFGGGDRRDFVPGVEYRLDPENGRGPPWQVDEGVVVRRADK